MNEENKAVELTDEQLGQVNGGMTISSLSDLDGLTAAQVGPTFILNGVVYQNTHKVSLELIQPVVIYENADGGQVFILYY